MTKGANYSAWVKSLVLQHLVDGQGGPKIQPVRCLESRYMYTRKCMRLHHAIELDDKAVYDKWMADN